MIAFDYFTISEQGGKCNTNEDYVMVNTELGLFIVADGIGGRPAGALASKIATETFSEQLQLLESCARVTESKLKEAMNAANTAVRLTAETNPMFNGLGTTLSAVILQGRVGKTIHIGDSRIYLFHQKKLIQLTKDHTLVAELIDRNHLTVEGAKQYPLRNVLSRSIGASDTIEADIGDIEVQHGDWLLLTTDGLSKIFEKEQLQKLIYSSLNKTPKELCEIIVGTALEYEPKDNITIAAIRILEK